MKIKNSKCVTLTDQELLTTSLDTAPRDTGEETRRLKAVTRWSVMVCPGLETDGHWPHTGLSSESTLEHIRHSSLFVPLMTDNVEQLSVNTVYTTASVTADNWIIRITA